MKSRITSFLSDERGAASTERAVMTRMVGGGAVSGAVCSPSSTSRPPTDRTV